jgi:hypothetical protein
MGRTLTFDEEFYPAMYLGISTLALLVIVLAAILIEMPIPK